MSDSFYNKVWFQNINDITDWLNDRLTDGPTDGPRDGGKDRLSERVSDWVSTVELVSEWAVSEWVADRLTKHWVLTEVDNGTPDMSWEVPGYMWRLDRSPFIKATGWVRDQHE